MSYLAVQLRGRGRGNGHGSCDRPGSGAKKGALGTEHVEEQFIMSMREEQRRASRREYGIVMTPNKKIKLVDFVRINFRCLECKTYVANTRQPPEQESPCCCGRPYDWHEQQGCQSLQADSAGSWITSEHTKEVKTTAFGQISFVGFPDGYRHYLAPYIRVSDRTPSSMVWEFVSEYWDLPAPKLLLSITGGAKRFFTKSREMQVFKKELVDAVKATGAWVLTCGLRTGVMQIIGQAVQEYAATVGSTERHKLVLLGVCPWGAIDNRDVLVGDNEGKFPTSYDAFSLDPSSSGTEALDNNHTHFIFVDDGTVGKFGGEIEWRAKFEKYISTNIKIEIDQEQSIPVPVVQLLINGGKNTLQTAAEAVENGTPLVVVGGTKRVAELLVEAYKMSANISWYYREQLRQFINHLKTTNFLEYLDSVSMSFA